MHMDARIPRTEHRLLFDNYSLTTAAGATTTPVGWVDVLGLTKPPCGFLMKFTSAGSGTIALTFRWSWFRENSVRHPSATLGNYTDVTLASTAAKDTWHYFFPTEFEYPIASYTLIATASTANTTGLYVYELRGKAPSSLESGSRYGYSLDASAHDVNDLPIPTKGIYVGVGGDVYVDHVDGDANVPYLNLRSGAYYPIRAKRIRSTNLTASSLVGWA